MIGATTRRSLLTGGAAAIAVAAAPVNGAGIHPNAHRWEVAHRIWKVALAEARSVSEAARSPSEYLASDEAWNVEGEAWRTLIDMPAPHGPALLWKLECLMEVEGDGDSAGWEGVIVAAVMADARRMLGAAA